MGDLVSNDCSELALWESTRPISHMLGDVLNLGAVEYTCGHFL